MTRHNREKNQDYGRENREFRPQQDRNRNYSFDAGRNANDASRQREFNQDEGHQGYGESGRDNDRRMQTSYYGRDYQQGRDRGDYEGTDMETQDAWNRASRHESYGQQNYGRNMSQGTDRGMNMQDSHAGRGPKNYKRRDDRIEEDVNEQLTQHHMIDATEIEVSVKDGEVTLRGTVETRDTKRMAEDIADSVSGVKDVRNEIKVQRQQGRQDTNKTQDNRKEKGDKEKAA